MEEKIIEENVKTEQEKEEKRPRVYDFCAVEDKIFPFVWRGAFLAKICNIQIPENTEVVSMTEEEWAEFSAEKYSDALAHLLILYGAGYITHKKLSELAEQAPQYTDEILSAERYVIKQSGNDEKNQVSKEYIESILLCTITSRKISEIQTVDFEMARSLCEGPYTTIRNGYVYVKDVGFFTLLANVGEVMGIYQNEKVSVLVRERYIGEISQSSIDKELNEKKESENTLPDMPFLLNLVNTYYIQKIYGRPYAVEFISYAKSEGIPFDENFSDAFEEYVHNFKMKLTVSAIARKRNICVNDINWFDYGTTKYLDKRIVIDEKYDVTAEIDLNDDIKDNVQFNDDVLIDMAMNKFISQNKVTDQTVIEVTFCGKKFVYLYDKAKNKKHLLDNDKFRKIPFDYNNVWTTVMEWSRSKLIQKKGDCIVVPDAEMAKIAENDREYARRMIEEQYSLKKNGNKMLQKLSELKSYAKGQMDIKEQQAKFKEEREASVQEDKKNESVNS